MARSARGPPLAKPPAPRHAGVPSLPVESVVSIVVETARLRLRRLEADRDAAAMLVLLNDPGFLTHIGDRGVRDEAQARTYLADGTVASYAAHGFGLYAVERRGDEAWIGVAGLVLRPALPAPDIGYALLPQYRGHGYAREAAQAVLDHARDGLKLPRLCAIVSPGNAASARLLEALGFRGQGTVRIAPETADVLLYARDLDAAPAQAG